MSKYCAKNGPQHLPPDKSIHYDHLLYDDKKKIVYCYVPKVGCSKWKYTFLLLYGRAPFADKAHRLPSQVDLWVKVKRLSDLPMNEIRRHLANYYKYVFIRNPMERVLSAYLDKIAHPLDISLIKKKFEERYKENILKALRLAEYNRWLKNGSKGPIYPTFSEYVQYLNMINLKEANEHFKPIIYLCHPCAINYNFYGNFKLLPKDANALIKHFKLNSSYYDSKSYISHTSYKTSNLVHKYFSELTALQKETLFYSYADELDFYYSLYPEEMNSHLNL